MKAFIFSLGLLLVTVPVCQSEELDLKRIAPPNAHLVIHSRQNPERDYQQELLAKVWKKVESEEIVERFLKIITSRVPEEELTSANALLEEFRQAIEPVHGLTSKDCEESFVAQIYQFPTNHTIVAIRFNDDAAEKCEAAFKNLVALVERLSQGKVPVSNLVQDGNTITSLVLPPQVMMQPCLTRVENVLLFSTSQSILSQALMNLGSEDSVSKFDDPRLTEALQYLPEPEDSLVFFDVKQLFAGIRGFETFIKSQPNAEGQAEKLGPVVQIVNLVLDELEAVDYTIAVEYTEGHANRSVTLEKYVSDAHEKLLGKLVLGGKPFTDWQRWVPVDAEAYSLNTGIQLHQAYEHLLGILQSHFPQTQESLDKFAQMQEQIDLRLDKDIFQSFSGESVSVTLPGKEGHRESVSALKCSNPERIKELLHRLVAKLASIPALTTQQIALQDTDDLAGFETLNASMLAAFNVQPVIGFHEDWLIIGSSKAAVQHVLAAQSGEAPTITSSEHFEKFQLPVQETVSSLSYTDLHAEIHNAADMIRKIGGIAPMFVGMAANQAKAEELKVVSELLALLPSVANVVEEFDFYDSRLATTSEGPLPGSFLKQSVTLIEVPVTEAN